MSTSKQDHQAAFAAFVHARSSALHRAAYLMVGEVSLAQDLVQESLVKTYAPWPRLRDPGNAEAYCRKAIRRLRSAGSAASGGIMSAPTAMLPKHGSVGIDG